jgi:hypothetical protein
MRQANLILMGDMEQKESSDLKAKTNETIE